MINDCNGVAGGEEKGAARPDRPFRILVVDDDAKAVELYREAAELGIASAQNNLGLMYRDGRGVDQDDGKALEWLRRAADLCDSTAQYNLGQMYENGRGVTQDRATAIAWYWMAAAQGQENARKALTRLVDA